MNKRLTISLPEQTIRLLHRLAGRGHRSRLINQAVRRYVELKRETGVNLRKQLADSYAVNAPHSTCDWPKTGPSSNRRSLSASDRRL